MGDNRRNFGGNSRGGGRSFGGNRFGGNSRDAGRGRFGSNRDGGDREMFDAVCANCGSDCKVPFRPSGDKEVFCSRCFGDRNQNDNRRSFDSNDNKRSRDYNDRPPRRESTQSAGLDRYERGQLEGINRKLEAILSAIAELSEKKTVKKAAKKEKVVKEEDLTPQS